MGHIIGFAHDDNPNSLMYGTAQGNEYGTEHHVVYMSGGITTFIPICTTRDVTNYNYDVSVESGDVGFDVKFVPS